MWRIDPKAEAQAWLDEFVNELSKDMEMWRIDSDGNAYNHLGLIIAPFEKILNGKSSVEIYLWIPQIDFYDELATVGTMAEARAYIRGYAAGYNDRADVEETNG